MIYIYARFLQRAESYAFDQQIPHMLYRICSQPQTAYGHRYEADDEIVIVGDVPDNLLDIVKICVDKSEQKPPISKVWLDG